LRCRFKREVQQDVIEKGIAFVFASSCNTNSPGIRWISILQKLNGNHFVAGLLPLSAESAIKKHHRRTGRSGVAARCGVGGVVCLAPSRSGFESRTLHPPPPKIARFPRGLCETYSSPESSLAWLRRRGPCCFRGGSLPANDTVWLPATFI